ncbi:MAG: hypothetical protein ACRDHS_03885 [Actinomycetota bacterium]
MSVRSRGAAHVLLAPLDQEEVGTLATALLGAEPGPKLQRQLDGAGGSPLFVTELLLALEGSDAIKLSEEGRPEIEPGGLPSSLALIILHRLSFLPEETLEVLRVASILGASFTVADLSLVLGTPAVRLMTPLRQCLRAGILREEGRRLAFRADLLREALYEDLPLAVRTGLHLEAARVFASAGVPVGQLAEHVARGASPGDQQAVSWLRQAAREAGHRAPAVAADLLERALALCLPSDPARDVLLAERVVSLVWSGRILEAETTCREVLARDHDPSMEGTLRMGLFHSILARGRVREALGEADQAITSPTLSDRERVQFQALAASARPAAQQAKDAAERIGDQVGLCISFITQAMVENMQARLEHALALANRAVELADRSRNREAHRFHLRLFRAACLWDLDRLDEAREDIQQGRRVSEELGAKWNLPLYHGVAAAAHFVSGKWDDALAEFQAGLDLAEEIGTRLGFISFTA